MAYKEHEPILEEEGEAEDQPLEQVEIEPEPVYKKYGRKQTQDESKTIQERILKLDYGLKALENHSEIAMSIHFLGSAVYTGKKLNRGVW